MKKLLPLLAAPLVLVPWLVAPALDRRALRIPFTGRNYAHRGLFTRDQTIPENSLPAFAAAARAGYGIELDVQFSADRRLVVFHDDTLDRMTGAHGRVQDRTCAELRALRLAGTDCGVPLFSEALRTVAAAGQKTPLIVEIKSRQSHSNAYLDALCRAVLAQLRSYTGPYCIESFDPRVVWRIRRLAPDVLRGQLVDQPSGYRQCGATVWQAYLMSHCLANFAARPHFIAWCPARRNWAVRLCAALRAMMVYWTALPTDDADDLQRRHDGVIFQWYTPAPRYRS